ncbi:hypothetical protein [Guptibacillus hwajinpoensis]|uniref:Uncharacterized protein n=1 Tax=Guptibacillus hwajinpoensis TaxID=208199 RepID=A0A0J6CYX6_9BACL|nr:hypothetical protein [Alkalihalobacillus macyae]KMM38303.1 hypothetical protein AB986_03035 [Alkalihalobacillus macyae]
MLNKVDYFFYPVDVTQPTGAEVTYYWEISVAEYKDKIYAYAKADEFGRKIRWHESDQPDKESALAVIQEKCRSQSK